MLSHNETTPQQSLPPPTKRRKRRGSVVSARVCPHCGRTFKRTEHLERHVRTHTKEKPFICHCGAAFTRRDLLTRHQRIASHEEESDDGQEGASESAPSTFSAEQNTRVPDPPLHRPPPPPPPPPPTRTSIVAGGNVPLGSMNVGQWPQQMQPVPPTQPPAPELYPIPQHGEAVETGQFQNSLLPPQFFDSGQDGNGFDTHFREFANFLDGVGLPAEWSPYFQAPERDEVVDPVLRSTAVGTPAPGPPSGSSGRAGTPFSSWLPSAPSKNKVPQGLPENSPRAVDPDVQPFRVTDDQRARLAATTDTFRDLLNPDFRFPSRHALTRHITSFFEGFHSHMPFLHAPTWRISEHSVELILAIATIGSQYCFERRNSERLFYAGKNILLERIRSESHKFGPRTRSYLGIHDISPFKTSPQDEYPNGVRRDWGYWEPIETVRALILLMGYATWENQVSLLQEAFTLQGLLAQVLRDIGLNETDESDFTYDHGPPQVAWETWVNHESIRRAKLISFSFLHTHSIAYNIYPVLRTNEINLRLPCSTPEWKAPTAQQWQVARRETPKEQLFFQEALSILLKKADGTTALDPIPTPLANYLLLHGLLQRIFIVRDLSLPVMDHSAALPGEEVDKLESGLRSWTSGWQQAPESSLDPNNENGPIPFTSSSLLGLAYVRLYLHLGPYRQLESRDPIRIAQAISRSPGVDRSEGVVSALLYSIHMLSIPVRLGVDRVARSQAFFWSVRHSLAGLEGAVFLSKWLFSLAGSVGTSPLTENEDRLLHWVWCIVDEASSVVDFAEDEAPGLVNRQPGSLGLAVLQIWAHFFKSNTQWPFINLIGRGLQEYRRILLRGDGHVLT